MKYYLALDIGGTACKIGLLDQKGNVLRKDEKSVNFDNYKTPIIETVVKESKIFLKDEVISGIAISCTGQIDTNKGMVIGTCGNIPNFINSPFKQRFEKEFNVETSVINDANCMILGEKWLGKCKDDKDAIGITIGTGIGGGIIVNNKILLGSKGLASEIGHVITNHNSHTCTCGNKGCLEPVGSTKYLCQIAEKELGVLYNGKTIFEEVKKNNKKVIKIVDQWIDQLKDLLVSLVHIFNPSVILIGGGVSNEEELLIKVLREKVLDSVMPSFREGLRIESAQLKNDAGMIGALYYFLNKDV